MKIVIGLGNPGPEYDWTRHNIGFQVLDQLARQEGVLFTSGGKLPPESEPYRGPKSFGWARLFDPNLLLIKPTTFMNASGRVVGPLARWAGLVGEEEQGEIEGLMVVYDDLDLELNRLRLRPHGGAGGHNGMKSIIEVLGSNRFPRLRIGIGSGGTDAARHVLGQFTERERPDAEISIAEATEAILDWARTGDIEDCMTRFHSRWNQV